MTASGDHSGSSAFERLSCTAKISAAATQVRIGGAIVTGNTTAQFDALTVLGSNGRFSNIDLDELPDFYAGAILDEPTITRRLQETRWGPVEVQDVTVTLANIEGALTPGVSVGSPRDARGRCGAMTGRRASSRRNGRGSSAMPVLGRGTLTLEGTNLDMAVLEEEIPRGLIDKDTYPLAESGSIGQTPTWLFGNVYSLPLRYIRDDLPHSLFDYLVCRDRALTLVERLAPGLE